MPPGPIDNAVLPALGLDLHGLGIGDVFELEIVGIGDGPRADSGFGCDLNFAGEQIVAQSDGDFFRASFGDQWERFAVRGRGPVRQEFEIGGRKFGHQR